MGFSGGIWVLWNDSITLNIIASNPQFLLVNAREDRKLEYTIAFLYASPTPHLRRKLWNTLAPARFGGHKSWLAVGDFNSVSSAEEVSNPGTYDLHRNAKFNQWIFQEGLIDMGYNGARFTWMRGNEENTFKGARLDRALGSSEWMDMFSDTTVTHLPMFGSDHAPVKVTTVSEGEQLQPRFFFQAAWPLHDSFSTVVSENWNQDSTVMRNVQHMAGTFMTWNRRTFGNIHAKKRRLLARLGGIQKALACNWHNGLVKLNKKLRIELEEVLNQEELMWYQQSQESWIKSGDRNTKFYHLSTKVRQKQRRSYILTDTTGRVAKDHEESGNFIQKYFSNIFSSPSTIDEIQLWGSGFPTVDSAHWSEINCPISQEEVKRALFDMAPYKAPGPDSFPAGFYQKAWAIVGKTLSDLVTDYFRTGVLPEGINDTLISLIPKTAHPESVTQFRPISLCNVSYKIITKVMVNRIKPILERLVSQEQSSFVPGRQIVDNIVVYQEVLHSLRKCKGSNKYMVIKVDLEKAYDRLSWNFIRDTLRVAGFDESWIRNIMGCVETSRLALLWNGRPREWFYPKRGVRQGDALSPYLFVLCIERLNHLIKRLVEEGRWKGIRLSNQGPMITHLFFADDLVLIAEATPEQMREVKGCLDIFCAASRQRVSINKFEVFFSPTVTNNEAKDILQWIGMPQTEDLGRYLGVPSIHGRVTKSIFRPLLQKISDKLEGWRARHLTLAGRLTLAKSVLSTIPYFAMQTLLLPSGVCEEIDKRIRTFLWGSSNNPHKCHLVKWTTVTLDKESGGLGIRSTKAMNIAFLAKLIWRLLNSTESLWARVLAGKYMHGQTSIDNMSSKRGASNIWRGMISAKPFFKQGCRRIVNNGIDTKFWKDVWICDTPLEEFVVAGQGTPNLEARVLDMWRQGQGWKWEVIETHLPRHVVQKLEICSLGEHPEEQDGHSWRLTATSKFSVSSMYHEITKTTSVMQDIFWKKVWKIKAPMKMVVFLWLVRHRKILCNDERQRRGLISQASCPQCKQPGESVEHMVRRCHFASEVWRRTLGAGAVQRNDTLPFDTWFCRSVEGEHSTNNRDSGMQFAVTIWWLWRWRNDAAFNGVEVDTDTKVSFLGQYFTQIRRAMIEVGRKGNATEQACGKSDGWRPTRHGEWVLNVDAATGDGHGIAGCGGVLRSGEGIWKGGFACIYPVTLCEECEAWAVLKGLEWAWQRNVCALQIQCDAENVVRWINGGEVPDGPIRFIILRCREWLNKEWSVTVVHVYRGQNRVADGLARMARRREIQWATFENPLPEIRLELELDEPQCTR